MRLMNSFRIPDSAFHLTGRLAQRCGFIKSQDFHSRMGSVSSQTSELAIPLEIVPGSRIYSTIDQYPFGGTSPQSRAFFLDRGGSGNVLMYSSRYTKDLFGFMKDRGGVELQLVNHRDEVGPSINQVKEVFDAPLGAHILEQPAIERKGVQVGRLLFNKSSSVECKNTTLPDLNDKNPKEADSDAEKIYDDLWAIHTPGHTEGATCFLYINRHDGKRYLFTGDTIYTSAKDKLDYYLAIHPFEGNIQSMQRSVPRIQSIQPNYIVPSLSQCSQFAVSIVPGMFDPVVAAIAKNRVSV